MTKRAVAVIAVSSMALLGENLAMAGAAYAASVLRPRVLRDCRNVPRPCPHGPWCPRLRAALWARIDAQRGRW